MKNWTIYIKPKRSLFQINIKEIWEFRDLIFMFIKRDIVTLYKQTILGPIWFFIQPILTMLVYIFVFANIAKLSTDGLPESLFYLSGIIMWNYFAECFNQTSDTFSQNSQIFGKVYFPRLILPISKIISGFIKFLIQSLLFYVVFFFYLVTTDFLNPSWWILLSPLLVILMAGFGLGFGLIFTSLTTKYRDLKFLIQFGVQLLMFATPIIYPLSSVKGKLLTIMNYNPFTHVFESFKFAFLGKGVNNIEGLTYSIIFMLFVLFLGVLIFNKTEKNFMDTV